MLSLFNKSVSLPGFQSLTTLGKFAFATKMQAGSTQNKKDSAGRRLGVKKLGGHQVFPNDVLVRQRGWRWHPGKNTFTGKDHTIHAATEGVVSFTLDPWRRRKLFYVNVEPRELPNRTVKPPPPYCYHPELFPERAVNNPEPTNFPIYQPVQKRFKDLKNYGSKVEKPVHRLNQISIPEHYYSLEAKEPVTIDQLAYDKVKELEAKYFDQEGSSKLKQLN